MNNKFVFHTILILLLSNCLARENSSEYWIDYDAVSKISIGITKEETVSILGEPLIIFADTEDSDNSAFLYYNYRIKSYTINNQAIDKNKLIDKMKRDFKGERITLIKFTFFDDELVSWEEDKMTLGMSKGINKQSSTFSHYFSLLLNVILLIKIL